MPQNSESNEQTGSGKASYTALVIWLLLMTFLAYAFSLYLENEHNPNNQISTVIGQNGSKEIHLLRSRHGHYMAKGYINDEAVDFLLDTGATYVAVPGADAKNLQLRRGPELSLQTATGSASAYATILDSVALGGIKMRNVRAVIMPEMQPGKVLLGMSFLKKLELSQQGDTLILRH